MRRTFSRVFLEEVKNNPAIIVLTGDLGFGMFDAIRDTFPGQFINCGASEQAMLDLAVGLAYAGKTPVVYSITPFLLYRAFETLRTYVSYEHLNVKLIGGGRDKNYKEDGISHWAEDAKAVVDTLPGISQLWPKTKEDVPGAVKEMLGNNKPYFLSLER